MRPLAEDELKTLFEKLAIYIGKNTALLIDKPEDPHLFVLQRDRVYYLSDKCYRAATSIARDNLISLGTCIGKFTKTKKFRLRVTALDVIAPFASYRLWIKTGSEMNFLYGNHVLKAHVDRMSENTPEHQGICVYSSDEKPLGFGVTAKSSLDLRRLDPTAIVVYHQSDVGEYLRDEDILN